MADPTDRIGWFLERCQRAGIKATHQRTEIFRELVQTEEHLDAEAIYERVRRRIPAMSQDTVYRNLRTLAEQRIIQKVGAIGCRTRFDANLDPHHHFVCTTCGLIRDFYSRELERFKPPRPVREMGSVDSVHLELRGICNACRSTRAAAP
jgi:Fur family peroxide stress response transcriptional regulator